ncbi:MAG: T9SS type A sorting domain-containing protein [Bacteroidia bacterium]|nr:T9SS type A sorting domain-containing protein [Bacteroidia bacterium]
MKQIFKLFSCLTFMFSGVLYGQSTWQWGKTLSGTYEDNIYDVTTDAQGNVYVCGAIIGAGTLGGLPFNTSQTTGSAYPFVAKFNSSGNLLWSKVGSFTGGATIYYAYPRSITVDKSGNVYVAITGTCNQSNGTLDFGGAGGPVFTQCTNAIIVKLNQNGVPQWGAYTYPGNGANAINSAQLTFDTLTGKLYFGLSVARATNGGTSLNLYNAGSSSANYIIDIGSSGGQESVYGELNTSNGAYLSFYRIGANDNSGGKEWIRDMKTDGNGNLFIGAELLYGTYFNHNGNSFTISPPGGTNYMKVFKLNSSLVYQGSTSEFSGTAAYTLNDISVNNSGEIVSLCSYDGASSAHTVEIRRFGTNLSSLGTSTINWAITEGVLSGKGITWDASGNIWATVGTSSTNTTAIYSWSPSFSSASAISNINSNNGLLLLKLSSAGVWQDYSLLKESTNNQFSVSNSVLPGKVAVAGTSVYVCGETYYNLTSGSSTIATGGSSGNGFVAKLGCDPILTQQPSNFSLCSPQQVIFTAAVTGSVTTKQWMKNGVNINGATGDTLYLNNATAADSGIYTFSATNSCGTTVSTPATLSAPPAGFVISTGLALYLPFINGARTDASGNNIAVSGPSGSAAPDNYNNSNAAMSFNGNQYNSYAHNAALNATGQLTVAMWFKATNIATAQRLIDKSGVGQNDNYMIDLYQSRLRVIIAGSAFQTTQTFSSNTWYHMAMVYDGANVKFYINGSPLQSFAKTGNCTPNSLSFQLGCDASGTNRFTGSMDEVRVYTRALTASEVNYLTVMPTFLVQPQTISRCLGTSASFTASTTGSNLSYQWYRNGNPIPNSNTAGITINSVALSDTGKYVCRVASNCIYTFSDTVQLGLTQGATISLQPQPVTACSGAQVNLVTATTGGSATYQWFKAISPVSGANSSQLLFNSLQAADSGMYFCRVTGACGTMHTDTVKLTVNQSATITMQPAQLTYGCKAQSISLSVTATGAQSYQWKRSGQNITGAVQNTYLVNSFSIADTGIYTVMVNGVCGNTQSDNAYVFLRDSTTIVNQPEVLTTICTGGTISIGVTTYDFNATYQWYFNSQIISGANTYAFNRNNATSADSGVYYAVITGFCNTVTSNIAVVVVEPTPAPVVQKNGNVLTSSISANSYQWFLNGNSISGATSQSYTVTQTGNYKVSVTTGAGCSGQSPELNVTVGSGTGVASVNSGGVMIFPNPVGNILNTLVNDIIDGTVIICSVNGQELMREKMTQGGIDVSALSAGIYLLRIEGDEAVATTRFIKN